MAFDPSTDRASVEAFYTARRLTELRLSPVDGCFGVAHLREMPTDIFVRFIAKLYTDLDYMHPFGDGNSRTLREFTRQLADEVHDQRARSDADGA